MFWRLILDKISSIIKRYFMFWRLYWNIYSVIQKVKKILCNSQGNLLFGVYIGKIYSAIQKVNKILCNPKDNLLFSIYFGNSMYSLSAEL